MNWRMRSTRVDPFPAPVMDRSDPVRRPSAHRQQSDGAPMASAHRPETPLLPRP